MTVNATVIAYQKLEVSKSFLLTLLPRPFYDLFNYCLGLSGGLLIPQDNVYSISPMDPVCYYLLLFPKLIDGFSAVSEC